MTAAPITPADRRVAAQQDADVEAVIAIGMPGFVATLNGIVTAALNKARPGDLSEFSKHLDENLDVAADVLRSAMIYARLRATLRIDKLANPNDPLRDSFKLAHTVTHSNSLVESAVAVLRNRANMAPATLRVMADKMNAPIIQTITDAKSAMIRTANEAITEAVQKGMHVKEAVGFLQKRLTTAGWMKERGGPTPARVEAVFRTQSAIAYAAAQDDALADPAVDSLLWGYKYVTVGDDRVRPSHAALEGLTRPKDDPFWQRNRPPNGWNCRCTLIPIFEERKPTAIPKRASDGSKPGADAGFDLAPADMLGGAVAPIEKMTNQPQSQPADSFQTQGPRPELPPRPSLPNDVDVSSLSDTKQITDRTRDMVKQVAPHLRLRSDLTKDDDRYLKPLQAKAVHQELARAGYSYPGSLNGVNAIHVRSDKTIPKQDAVGLFTQLDKKIQVAVGGHARMQGPLAIGGWSVDDSLSGTVRHEIGHSIGYTRKSGPIQDAAYELFKNETPEFLQKNLSKYAAESPQEIIAETWCAYTHPDYGVGDRRLHPKLEALARTMEDSLK